jgi:predicted  nucleic acid-binding Zn-ribbon protein
MSTEDRIAAQDNEPLPNIGNIVPDRDDSYHRQKQGKGKSKERVADDNGAPRSGGSASIYVWSVLTLALAGWAGFLHYQLTLAQGRVGALEERLSMTDESVNQSSVSMQVKLKELDASVSQIRDETLKDYKSQIDKQAAQIGTLDKTAKNAQAALSKLDQRAGDHDKALVDTRAQIDKLPPSIEAAKHKLDEHQAALDGLAGKLKAAADRQTKVEGRLNNYEEWVESINIFRKQMNREIVNIKQQVAGGKPPAQSEAPLP